MSKILKSDSLESTTISSISNGSLLFSTRPSDVLTTRLTITSSGDVGIKNLTPSSYNAAATDLVIGSGSSNSGITIAASTTGLGSIHFSDGTSGDTAYRGLIKYEHTTDNLQLFTSATERLRITSAGGISFGSGGANYGTSGQILTSQGNAAPIWVTNSTLTLNTSGLGLSGSASYTPAGAATFTVTSNATTTATANAIVARDAAGHDYRVYGFGTYFNSTDDVSGGNISHIIAKFGDNYYRSATAAKVAAFISGQSMNIVGNSTSVTDGVYLSTAQTVSGRKVFTANLASGSILNANGSLGAIEIQNTGSGNAAFLTFHRPSAFAAYFGLDTDNNFAVGGWSFGAALGSMKVGSFGVGTAASGTAGEIRATNNITAYYSDERLKNFIGKIPNALEKVNSLNGYYYKENSKAKELGYNNDSVQVGVSAQEVEKILPEIVTLAPIDCATDSTGETISKTGQNYKTVYYEKLIPLLIEAIKELSSEVNKLKK